MAIWALTLPCVYRAMIEALQAENADLKKNLSLAGSKQNEIKDQQITAKFEELIQKQGAP